MIKRLIAALILLSLLLISCIAVSFLLGYKIHRDVSYGVSDANKMDIYLPNKAARRESNGVIVFIHGGSWSGGDKSSEDFRCRLFASRGYVTATINYTLWTEETAGEYNVLGVLDEIDAALQRIEGFAADNGISVDRAAIAGYSAGAHLALLYSYSRAATAPLEVVFVGSMSGPADISEAVWGREMTKRVGRRLTGIEISDDMLDSGAADALLSAVSPTSYINSNSVPTLMMHGGRDDVVPVANADALIKRLSESSVKYDYVYMSRSDHVLWQNPLKHLTYTRLMLDYCRSYFGY